MLPRPVRALLPAALAALPLTALSLTLAGAQAAYPNYYPSAAGTRWTYSSGETQIVGAPVTVKGVKVVPVSHQYGSTTYSQDLLEYRADGSVWLRGTINSAGKSGRLSWYAPPLNVYPPAPLQPGQRWVGKTANVTNAYSVTGITPLRVGNQAYNALTLRTDTTAGGRTTTQLSYFVPSVGVVRYQTADGSVIDLLR